jgi:myo-inositol-1(or 4)-monophosphatase
MEDHCLAHTPAEYLEAAIDAARLGGRILQEWRTKFTAREKGPSNLVTEADVASQRAIFDFLHQQHPGHAFLGEEDVQHGAPRRDAVGRWIVDPLDGTSNYVHGFPYYAVSVAFEERGELIAGAIFDPNRDEMFSAASGEGAALNGAPIRVSAAPDLSQALCMASLPVKTTRADPAVHRFLRVLEAAQHVQRTGSAALNLCSVACGRVDAFWSTSLHAWDMAAGVLIVREAGGRVTRTDGGPFELMRPDLLATNGTILHQALVPLLS